MFNKIQKDNLPFYYNFFPDFCVIMLFFVTPLSSSAKSIFLILLVISTLLIPQKRHALFCLATKKSSIALLLLFFIAIIAATWSPATIKEIGFVIEKWSKLLYLPFLMLALRSKITRKLSFNAFLMAMLITSLLSIYLLSMGDVELYFIIMFEDDAIQSSVRGMWICPSTWTGL